MKPIEISDRMGYKETRKMVSELSRRVSLLMEMVVSTNQLESPQQFLFSENRIQLDVSDRSELLARIQSLEDIQNGN